jgi:hypothetical protein
LKAQNEDKRSNLTHLLDGLTSQVDIIQEAIKTILGLSVILPTDLIAQIENFIVTHNRLGFTAREDFVIDAITFKLDWLRNNNERLEISREQYDELNEVIKEMGMPLITVDEFIHNQINDILEKYSNYIISKRRNT